MTPIANLRDLLQFLKEHQTFIFDEQWLLSKNVAPLLRSLPEQKIPVTVLRYETDNPDEPRKIQVSGQLEPSTSWRIPHYTASFLRPEKIELTFTSFEASIHTALSLPSFEMKLGKLCYRAEANLVAPCSLHIRLAETPQELRPLTELVEEANQGLISGKLPGGAAGDIFKLIPLTTLEMGLCFAPEQRTTVRFTSQTGKKLELFRFDDGRSVGVEKVGVAIETDFLPIIHEESAQVRTGYRGYLFATLNLGREFDIVIILDGSNIWELSVKPQPGNLLPELAALAGMAGGAGLQKVVADGMARMQNLTGLEEFGVDAVQAGFNPYGPNLHYVTVDSHFTLKVAGQPLRFAAQLHLPEFCLSGELSKGYEIDLKRVVTHYFGEVGAFPEVKITELGVLLDPQQSYYAHHISLENDTELKLSEHLTLRLSRLELGIECFAGNFEGRVKADLVLAKEYNFFLAAELDKGKGCLFEGGLAVAQAISLKRFLNDVGKDFGITMPDLLPDLQVCNLLAIFATTRHAEPALTMPLADSDATTLRLSFSGDFSLADIAAGIALSLTTEEDRSVTIAFAANSPAGRTLSAFDLFAALFPAEDFQILKMKEIFDAGLEKVDFAISKKEGISGEARGKVVIATRLEVALTVKREKVAGAGWVFTANFAATAGKTLNLFELLPRELRIIPEELLNIVVKKGNVALDTSSKSFRFSLEMDGHLNLGGLGCLECSAITLIFRAGTKAADNELDFSATGQLKLLDISGGEDTGMTSPIVNVYGTFKVMKKPGTELEISFEADKKKSSRIDIPTLIPGKMEAVAADQQTQIDWVHLLFQLQTIRIRKESGWEFEAKFGLMFSNFPKIIDQLLPDKGFAAKLLLNQSGATITLDELFGFEYPFRVPAMENLPEIDLGIGKIAVSKLTATLGKTVAIEATIQLYLPSRLNYLFGAAGTHPRFEIFETYNPAAPDKSKSLDITFHARAGSGNPDVGVAISALPIRQIEKITIGNKPYWDVKLGRSTTPGRESEYGRVLIKVPTFDFDFAKGGFRAEGGFSIKEEPAIPMQPLKQLFTMAGLPKIADQLPASIPIPLFNPPKMIDDKGKLNVLGIQEFFRTYLKQELPKQTVDALVDLSACTLETLPKEFTKYLNPPKIGDLDFKIIITPDGGVDIMLAANPGLRMLFFSPPYFTGVELRSFSFGELLGGQLFSCRIDADFDQYDIITLAACMVLQDYKQYLGDTTKFRGKLEIDKLWTIFFYQAGFPVPIPLFYDKVGIDYHGLSNIKLQTSFKFPQPEPDLKDIIRMCGDLVKFLTDASFPLDPEKDYKPDLKFTVGPNYIDTGLLMGNRLIGLKDGLPTISAYKTLALLLNGIKFFSVNKIIRAIDPKYRVGDTEIRFFAVALEVRWLLTTPKEFRDGACKLLGVTPEQSELYLKVLPRSGDEEGVVALFQGVWKICNGEIAKLDTSFGMIAAGTNGFATGVRIAGYLKDVIDLKLQGVFLVDMKPPALQLLIQGECSLKFAGLEIFNSFGMIRIEDKRFRMQGHFRLFKDLPLINIAGDIDGLLDDGGIKLSGSVAAKLGPIVLGEARALVLAHQDTPERGVWIEALFLGLQVKFALEDRTDRLSLAFTANLTPLAAVNARLEIYKERQALQGDLTAEIAGFGRLRIECLDSGAGGKLRIEHLGLVIVEGTSESTPLAFTLKGAFSLFPPGALLNILADANGSFSKRDFALSGDIRSVTLLPGILSGAKLDISNQGVSFGLSFLGLDVGWVKVIDRDGWIVMAFRAGLGPFLSLTPTLSVNKDGKGGSCAISGGIGDLLLDASLALGAAARGSYAIRVAGFTLLGGNIWIDQAAFSLDGKINFTIIAIDLNGWIRSSGIFLKGSVEFGIWPVKLGIEVIIDNGLPAVRIWDVLGILRIRSALMPYQGALCSLAAWYHWLWWPFFGWVRYCNYLALGPTGIVCFAIGKDGFPADWPLIPDSCSMQSYLEEEAEAEPMPLLAVVRTFLEYTAADMTSAMDITKENYTKVARSVTGYGFELRMHPEEDDAAKGCAVEVTIHKTPYPEDFFTLLQEQVEAKLIEKGLGKRIEEEGIESLFGVGDARAHFHRASQRRGTVLTIAYRSSGKERFFSTAFDFNNPNDVIKRLATQLTDGGTTEIPWHKI